MGHVAASPGMASKGFGAIELIAREGAQVRGMAVLCQARSHPPRGASFLSS